MSATLPQRLQAEQEMPEIEVKAFSGLSLKIDRPNQPAGVWQTLDNFDLYVPGSIRKILPSALVTNVGHVVLNFASYYAQPNKSAGPTLRLLGLAEDSKIYNLITGAVWVDLTSIIGNTVSAIPFIDVMPMYYVPFNMRSWRAVTAFAVNDAVLKYSAVDGNLYVFRVSTITTGISGNNEPTWVVGNVVDVGVTWTSTSQPNSERFQENALIVVVPGFKPILCIEYQFDPTSVIEVPSVAARYAGVFAPTSPAEVEKVTVISSLSGYSPVAGRAYTYTWYNPHTLHESSPAPIAGKTKITETDNSNMVVTINGSILLPLPGDINGSQFESYQSLYMSIPMSQAQAAAALGYTMIIPYASRDGGATFFRMPQTLDDTGNLVSNSDGSVAIATLITLQAAKTWQDYTPLPTPQALRNSLRLYEGSGPVNLAPDPFNLGPASWLPKAGHDMVVVPGDAPSGGAAIEYVQPTAATPGKKNIYQSNTIDTTDGLNYYFQGFLDALLAVAGTIRWEVTSGDGLISYLTLVQAAGVAGTLSGTFLKPVDGKKNIRIRAYANNVTTGADGDTVVYGDPLLIVGVAASTVAINYPTLDTALVIPSPEPLSQNPPPVATAAAVYQGSLFLVEQGTFRVFYSISGDVQSYGANAFLPLDREAGAPVQELATVFDRLIIGKVKSVSQVLGNNQDDFRPSSVDPQHGIIAARASIALGSAMISLLNIGLSLIGFGMRVPAPDKIDIALRAEQTVGDPVKPLTDQIDKSTLRIIGKYLPCPAVDNTQNIYLFAFTIGGPNTYNNNMLADTLTHKGDSPWSTFSGAMPAGVGIVTVKEIQYLDASGNISTAVFASGSDGKIYRLFGGTQDGSVAATATTWPLPDLSQLPFELRDTIKVFREMWVEGADLANWLVSYSGDMGNTFTTPVALQGRNKIGLEGRQIVVKLTHSTATTTTPLLSYMKIEADIVGQAAGTLGLGANF